MPHINKTVIASYYPWYHNKSWRGRVHRPLAGEYNSMTKETIARHAQLADEAGIDVFAQEWNGRGVAYSEYDTERAFQTVLDGLHADYSGYAALMKNGAPWVTITTFNEYYEGSEIEPTEEHSRLYIDITKERRRLCCGLFRKRVGRTGWRCRKADRTGPCPA